MVRHLFKPQSTLPAGEWKDYYGKVWGGGERRAGVGCRKGRLLSAFALPGDEGLIADAVTAGESHGAQAAAVEGVQQLLALGRREAQPTVAAGADDGGVGGGGLGWCGLHTRLCMLPMPPPG